MPSFSNKNYHQEGGLCTKEWYILWVVAIPLLYYWKRGRYKIKTNNKELSTLSFRSAIYPLGYPVSSQQFRWFVKLSIVSMQVVYVISEALPFFFQFNYKRLPLGITNTRFVVIPKFAIFVGAFQNNARLRNHAAKKSYSCHHVVSSFSLNKSFFTNRYSISLCYSTMCQETKFFSVSAVVTAQLVACLN